MPEVTLVQMLDARERRVWEQQRLLQSYGKPLVCFSMNIPGPVKDSPLIRRSFAYGCGELEKRIPPEKLLYHAAIREITGCEAMYVVDLPALALKKLCVEVEDANPLGRLFDMDVLDVDGIKLDRDLTDGKSRDCIVCGAPGRGCASRRVHSVPELQAAVRGCMRQHFAAADARDIGTLAVNALREEVTATPKPGLVDRRNTGSHRDMNLHTFEASAAALGPYFTRCVTIGQHTAEGAPEETFAALRRAGLEAEQVMLAATGGVNTHKGAIFTMGLLCGAAGRLWDPEVRPDTDVLLREVAAMTFDAMAADHALGRTQTAGEKLYASSGVRGARGEAALGLPNVGKVGLPMYRSLLNQGADRNTASVRTLLHLIASVEDTNMLHRGGKALAREGAERARTVLEAGADTAAVEVLDDWFIEKNLSPGGCADLLAAVIFVSDLERRQIV